MLSTSRVEVGLEIWLALGQVRYPLVPGCEPTGFTNATESAVLLALFKVSNIKCQCHNSLHPWGSALPYSSGEEMEVVERVEGCSR